MFSELKNISIRQRLFFLAAIFVLGIGTTSGVQWMTGRSGDKALEKTYKQYLQPIVRLQSVERNLNAVRGRLAGVLLETESLISAQNNLQETQKEILVLWADATAPLDDEQKELLADAIKGWPNVNAKLEKLADIYSKGDTEAMTAFLEDDWPDMVSEYIKPLRAFIAAAETQSDEAYQAARKENHELAAFSGGLALLSLSTVLLMGWRTRNAIIKPLEVSQSSVQALGRSDLTATQAKHGQKDEFGQLLADLESTRCNLVGVVDTVRNQAQVVADASQEISAGNQDLCSRTENQAAALQQCAASIHQLMASVGSTTEIAQSASELANKASRFAQSGGEVVTSVLSAMDTINTSSKKATDIIGVIDDIAFQTNLLALNAAVEAAHAGSAGRGFVVVADEVRKLSRRCADAAKEIRDLIGQSNKHVAHGSELSKQAANSISDVVRVINDVNEQVQQIHLQVSDQNDAVSQINTAVQQLDETTQQNAALVEQSTAAASSLKDSTASLLNSVQVFKLV